MLLTALYYIVLLAIVMWSVYPTLAAHSLKDHKAAAYKCFFLWALSTLPVFISLGLTQRDKVSLQFLMNELTGSPFSASEQLIYASTFIAPALFIFTDALVTLIRGEDEGKVRRFRHVLRTYHRVLLPSIVLMMVSLCIFAAIKTDISSYRGTLLYRYVGGKEIYIYTASIVYWYCTVVIEASSGEDYAMAAG